MCDETPGVVILASRLGGTVREAGNGLPKTASPGGYEYNPLFGEGSYGPGTKFEDSGTGVA